MKIFNYFNFFSSFERNTLPVTNSDSSLVYHKMLQITCCTSGIYFIYLLYGLLQEKIFTTVYDSSEGPYKFKESSVIVLIQTFLSFLLAKGLNLYRYSDHKNEISRSFGFKLGTFNTISMLGSISALNYVSYPVQALMKSSKILSVMLVTLIIGGKKHKKLEYFCALFITVGIFLFNLLGHSGLMDSENRNSSFFGLFLLTISLFSDGMLAEYQRRVRESSTTFTAYDLMESSSKYTLLFCLIYSIFSSEIILFTRITQIEYFFIRDLMLICFLGAFGQLFVFFTIMIFGPILLSVITTTRKFFTVLCSIIIFQHSMNIFQWISVIFVFTGVGFELYENIRKEKEMKKFNV